MSSPPPPPPGWNPPPGGPSWPPPDQPHGQQPGTPPPFQPGTTPPPFAAPGTPPPFGLPGPQPPLPPPRRAGAGTTVAILLGGGLVVVLILAAAFVVLLNKEDKTPTERLAAAARSLGTARALTLQGTFGTERISGQVQITSSGRVTGPVTWQGRRMTLLNTGEELFVKADRSYWAQHLRSTNVNDLPGNGEQWGKLSSDRLTFSFKQHLTPAALAAKMRSVTKATVRSDTETVLRGRAAVKITTLTGTFYVSEDDRLLRVESVVPYFNADVTAHSGSDADAVIGRLRSLVGELKDAWDTTRTSRPQKIEGCKNGNASGCTVRVRLWTSGAGSESTQVSVYVWITETTRTGRRLGECSTTATTTGLESVWAECRVSGAQWSDFYRRTKLRKPAWMQARVVAMAFTPGRLQELQSALDRE